MKALKNIIAGALLAVCAFGANAQTVMNEYGRPENFSDMVLIYAGNSSRNSWNRAQLTPYVTHKYADGTEDWLFDSFLFLEFVRYRNVDGMSSSVGFGNGIGRAYPATQDDWKWILDEYFTTGTSWNATKLAALDCLIGEKIQQLGAPAFRHKVVIVCPAPKKEGNVWSSKPWGTINGQTIALNTQDNRLAAVKWYIDELVSRWESAGYKNIDLEGIYWIEESMISNAGIIADVNDYARSKGLRTYWIPFYHDNNETYCSRWKSNYKFDMCYYQPGYAFYRDANRTTYPISQLTYTCDGAKKYGAGLEVEFETSGSSNCLHSVDPAAHQRLNDYLDVYTDKGVFDEAGVAYYVGSRGLNDMKASTDPVDHATMDRMASIIAARIKAKYGDPDALEAISVDKEWAYAGNGKVLTTTQAECYDISGRLVHKGIGLFDCPAGVYILRNSNGESVKLVVK